LKESKTLLGENGEAMLGFSFAGSVPDARAQTWQRPQLCTSGNSAGEPCGRKQQYVRLHRCSEIFRAALWSQMPAPKIGRPKTEVKRETFKMPEPTKEPEVESGAARGRPKTKRVTDTDFVPMWKVILLGDEEYQEKHVIESLVKTIPKMDKEEARRIYREAQAVGESIVTVVAQEHAEFYASMLRRCSLYVRIEPE
jgi:ATP-dependent Clp protease adapter protein ClpS